jgi:GDP-4-dehydro-6-deoxy-D-mannose reductase
MKRALIFGASGFVGPYLAREMLDHGYEVSGADFHETNAFSYTHFYSVDLTDKESVKKAIEDCNPTHIFNLAAISSVGQSWKDPELTMRVNTCGAINIMDAAYHLSERPRVLLVGSSEEYLPSDMPLSEDMPINANNPYGVSKVAQERLGAIYRKQYGLLVYCVRAFNHIGVGQRPSFVIPSWCKQVAEIEKSEKPGIICVGNLNVSRDFSDVRDIVRAYRMVIESNYSDEIFNIGSGKAVSLRSILSTILSFSSQSIQVETDSSLLRPVDNAFICCDNSKIKRLIGWEPTKDLTATLKDIYSSFLIKEKE